MLGVGAPLVDQKPRNVLKPFCSHGAPGADSYPGLGEEFDAEQPKCLALVFPLNHVVPWWFNKTFTHKCGPNPNQEAPKKKKNQ